jgi:hypothetical protein
VDETADVLDEAQAWFLAQPERGGCVYTSVLRQLVDWLYRDQGYWEKRKPEVAALLTTTRLAVTRKRPPGPSVPWRSMCRLVILDRFALQISGMP